MFIETCSKFHKLYPCHYFTFPGLSWDAILKMTVVKLEKLTSTYLLKRDWEEGFFTLLRDTVKQITNTLTIMILQNRQYTYLDMNNLYGRAMTGYLPYGGFKWLKNADNFVVNSISENSSIG